MLKSDIILTPMKCKVINVLSEDPKNFKSIVSLSGLHYKQIEYLTQSLVRDGIIQRSRHGYYFITDTGLEYKNLIKELSLEKKDNFKLKGQVDKSKFLDSIEGAIITAAILSDGCLLHNRINFLTNDTSLNNFVWDTLERIFNKKVNRNRGFLDGRINVEFLRMFSPTYHTEPNKAGNYPLAKIPDFIMNGSLNQKRWFLRTYLSCDGGMCFQIWQTGKGEIFYIRTWVGIACKHPGLINDLMKLLKSMNFNPQRISSGVALWKSDIPKYKEIGFIDGCCAVHGKFWKGVEKNKLLELACLIREFGSHLVPYKLRKQGQDEVIAYLRNVIDDISSKGYESVHDSLEQNKKEFIRIKSASKNWKAALIALKQNHNMKYNSIASFVYPKDPEINRNHKICIDLSMCKRKGLIINKNENWSLTGKGLEYLETLSKYKSS